jgi:MFS transporter, FHS family, L-fucose permease
MQTNFNKPFAVISFLFFMLGFITCMNDLLVPLMKRIFLLSHFQATLVQFAFFGAYFFASLIYFLISYRYGDPMLKMGYKKAMLFSLLLSALGCFLFYPATIYKSYNFFLIALFILALGFAVLQIAINPYVAILGKPETASSRLNLSQAFNSFATAIAPLLGGYLIFNFFSKWGSPMTDTAGNEIALTPNVPMSDFGVQLPYLFLGLLFVILFLILLKTALPSFKSTSVVQKNAQIFKNKQLMFGTGAIFMYVGAEVSIGSFLILYQQESLGLVESIAKSFLSFYWGGAMIGRFLGALALGKMRSYKQYLAMIAIAVSLYVFLYFSATFEHASHFSVWDFAPFLLPLILHIFAFYLGNNLPSKILAIFASIAGLCLLLGLFLPANFALWCFVAVGLFNSIMFPTIFTLSIQNLGDATAQGSSLLVMAILGGAIVPPMQGLLADAYGINISFALPILCYVYILFFALYLIKTFKK